MQHQVQSQQAYTPYMQKGPAATHQPQYPLQQQVAAPAAYQVQPHAAATAVNNGQLIHQNNNNQLAYGQPQNVQYAMQFEQQPLQSIGGPEQQYVELQAPQQTHALQPQPQVQHAPVNIHYQLQQQPGLQQDDAALYLQLEQLAAEGHEDAHALILSHQKSAGSQHDRKLKERVKNYLHGLLGFGGGSGGTANAPAISSGSNVGMQFTGAPGSLPNAMAGGMTMMSTSVPAGTTTGGQGPHTGGYYSSTAVNMTGRPATNALTQEYDLATTTVGGQPMNWTGGRTMAWEGTKEGTRLGAVPGAPPVATRGTQSLDISYDFTRPEGSRTRPLICEGRSLYVCEHYMSIWSPVLKTFIIECPNRELILPNIRYDYMLDVLETVSPMHKDVTEKNLHYILPIASEFQMEGLLHRCELYLMDNVQFPILEKLWLADRYKLKRLLHQCLKEIRPQSRIDISGPKYYTLSDRVKVMVLERIQGAKAPDPQPIGEPPVDASVFHRMNETNYASIKGKNGRAYYCNPYYLAAWSNLIADRMNSQNLSEFACGCTQEELKLFLMTIYPPQLRITEHNVAPILMAACKLESPAVMRRCANMILHPAAQLSVFAKLALLDRCFMHELLDTCLRGLRLPEQALEMTQQGTYDCLSTKARAAILDRLSVLLKNPGLAPHRCHRCQQCASCDSVNWVCPNCGSYCSAGQIGPSVHTLTTPASPNPMHTGMAPAPGAPQQSHQAPQPRHQQEHAHEQHHKQVGMHQHEQHRLPQAPAPHHHNVPPLNRQITLPLHGTASRQTAQMERDYCRTRAISSPPAQQQSAPQTRPRHHTLTLAPQHSKSMAPLRPQDGHGAGGAAVANKLGSRVSELRRHGNANDGFFSP